LFWAKAGGTRKFDPLEEEDPALTVEKESDEEEEEKALRIGREER